MKERKLTAMLPPIIQSLLKSEGTPGESGQVNLVQTQMSWILFAGNLVYKMKKPVDLGYVDYTTLEKRQYYCNREVELNRRLCPQSYLGVSTINLADGEYSIDGDGEVVDYAVKMKKLPQEKMLDYLLANNNPTADMLSQVAERVAAFHKKAETGPHIDPFGSIQAIRFNTEENFTQSIKYADKVVSRDTLDRIKDYTNRFLNNNSALFESRVKEGHIRDCHGDLHSSHICFTDELCIYDCIEFSDRFRYSDTAAEVAFLAMDIDHYGRADLSQVFIQRYLEMTRDSQVETLLNFYKCYRAMVRAKVNCFKLDDPYVDSEEKQRSLLKAQQYFDLAESYTLQKPWLLVNVGLVGSGKSTLAKELARHMGIVVISSDIVRKTLAGIPPVESASQGMDTGVYSPDFSRLTYETMFNQAASWLKKGVSVILDATFVLALSRKTAYEIAMKYNAGFAFLEYTISDEEACRRINHRKLEPGNVSDGTTQVYFKMKSEFEPLDKTEAQQRVIIDCAETTAENLAKVRHFIFNRYRS